MTEAADLPPFGLGYPRTDLRRKLVEAVLRGDKIATAGLASEFAPHTEELIVCERFRLVERLAETGT